mgnify:CR=1 FL=1
MALQERKLPLINQSGLIRLIVWTASVVMSRIYSPCNYIIMVTGAAFRSMRFATRISLFRLSKLMSLNVWISKSVFSPLARQDKILPANSNPFYAVNLQPGLKVRDSKARCLGNQVIAHDNRYNP